METVPTRMPIFVLLALVLGFSSYLCSYPSLAGSSNGIGVMDACSNYENPMDRIVCPSVGEEYYNAYLRPDDSSRFLLCSLKIKYVNMQGLIGIRAKFFRDVNTVLDTVGTLYERRGTQDFHFNETVAIFRIPYRTKFVEIGLGWNTHEGVLYVDKLSAVIEWRSEMGTKPIET